MSSVFLCLLVALLLCVVHCEEINSETPPPPLTGNLGGTKADKVALFEKYLNAGKPEQKAAYRDDNPILRPIHIHFNKTVQTQINGYAIHRVMLTSSDENCDRKAAESADAIMQKAFDDTVECLMQFRNRVRAEVNPDITDITEVPQEQKASLILPIDECFETMKKDTFKQFGQNTADHLICSKHIKN